jgi:hypothetical protein
MNTTLDLISTEENRNVYNYTDRTIVLAVVTGLIAAGEHAYFSGSRSNTLVTTATVSMVNAAEAAVLAYADMTFIR